MVDAEAGTRELAFDHDAAREAMGVESGALPVNELRFEDNGGVVLIGSKGRWRVGASGAIEEVGAGEGGAGGLELWALAPPSRNGGAETRIVFVNRLDRPVTIHWVSGSGEPRGYGEVAPGEQRDQHTFAGHVWLVRDTAGESLGYYAANTAGDVAVIDGREPRAFERRGRGGRSGRGRGRDNPNAKAVPSPDGEWEAFVKDHDLYVRRVKGGAETRLTDHGSAEYSFHRDAIRDRAIGMNYTKPDYPASLPHVYWSPDSKKLIALKTTVVAEPRVHMVESSPTDQRQPKLHSYPYIKPGDA
ncbi:MAG: VHL beta domain-containing protein, partial [Planctomycetota bacterium]